MAYTTQEEKEHKARPERWAETRPGGLAEFYLKCREKPLKGSKQGRGKIRFTVLQISFNLGKLCGEWMVGGQESPVRTVQAAHKLAQPRKLPVAVRE